MSTYRKNKQTNKKAFLTHKAYFLMDQKNSSQPHIETH